MRALQAVLGAVLAAGCSAPAERPPAAERGGQRPGPGATTAAKETAPPPAGLEEYLEFALAHNPGLAAVREHWKAAVERPAQMRALPDPQLMYEVTDMPDAREQMIALSQTVPWPGKLVIGGRVAEGEAEAGLRRYEAARLALTYRVKSAYYEQWYLGRAIAVARENLDLTRAAEATVRTRYRAAAAEYADLLKAQVEVARNEDGLRELEAMRGPVAARLNYELGRPAGAPPAEAGDAPPPERLAASDDEVLTWIEARSPELAVMDAQIRAARDSTALARRGPLPDLMLSAGPTFMEQDGMDREEGFKVGVGLTLPLWFGRYRAANREARARFAAARLSREEAFNRIGSEARMALFAMRDADRKVRLYREAIVPRAEQAAETARTAYAAGRVPFVELADSLRMLLEFRLELARALANRAQRLAELEMMLGRELPTAPEAGGEDSGREARP